MSQSKYTRRRTRISWHALSLRIAWFRASHVRRRRWACQPIDCADQTSAAALAVPARANPFRVDRTDALRFRFPSGTWSSQFDRLKSLRYRAAIVGPQGSGKSTLLLELAAQLREQGLRPIACRATADRRANLEMTMRLTKSSCAGQIILLDSAEMLPRMAWWRLLFQLPRHVGLVVTSHHRCALPTWLQCRTSWESLRTLLVDLEFPDDCHPVIAAARNAYFMHRGNIREVFRGLFDDVANGQFDTVQRQ